MAITRYISSIFMVVALGAGAQSIADAPAKRPTAKYVGKVTLEEARKIALKRVPGRVKTEELEKEKGRWIYSFIIKPDGETRKLVKEVNVDADTGKIVEVETETEK